jgi:hypothetical protein
VFLQRRCCCHWWPRILLRTGESLSKSFVSNRCKNLTSTHCGNCTVEYVGLTIKIETREPLFRSNQYVVVPSAHMIYLYFSALFEISQI